MPSTTLPFVSIIIPTYKRKEMLNKCLELLKPQMNSKDALQIIVSDDACDPLLKAWLADQFSCVHYNPAAGKGPAANRNAGAKIAEGVWFIFLDDDCLPEPDWVKSWIAAFQKNPEVDAWEGRVLALGSPKSLVSAAPINKNGNNFWSCNLAIKSTLFKQIGGFDEEMIYPAFEDIEFADRLRSSGAKMAFCEKALVYHPWKELNPIARAKILYPSILTYLKKHPEKWDNHKPSAQMHYAAMLLKKTFTKWIWKTKGRGLFSMLLFIAIQIGFSGYLAIKRPWRNNRISQSKKYKARGAMPSKPR
jgi:GT2 family glycosyltransferase